jgi:hypothetical protein
MTETADPRIALMQKWSQENPALMAQAGLATLATGAGESTDPHFIAGGVNPKRLDLLRFAGVDPNGHAHPNTGHPIREPKKGKSHKKKGKGSAHGGAHITVNGVHLVVGGHENVHQQPQKHKKKNPFMGADHSKLLLVYDQAKSHHIDIVNAAMSSVEMIHTKLPPKVRQIFLAAFQSIKRMKGSSSQTYEASYEKISEALSSYKQMDANLKYTLHMPHVIPSESVSGTASLLSKLINATNAFLRTHTKSIEERKTFGMYEFRTQLYSMANAKENCNEIKQALDHQKETFLKNTTHTHIARPSTNGGAVVRESAEHAFDNTFSMAHPYTP